MPRPVFPELKQIKNIKKAKKTRTTWEADCFSMFRGFIDDAYEKPVNERHFLLIDQKTGLILEEYLMMPEEGAEKVMDRFADAILEMGCPKEVVVPNKIVGGMLETLCDACGIRLVVGRTENCEEYKQMTDEELDPENLLDELEEMGFDTARFGRIFSENPDNETGEKMLAELGAALGEAFGDFMSTGEVEHELKNRKQKVSAVKDFFGQGTIPEEYYDEVEKQIEADWSEGWEKLLMQSSKSQLQDMALRMGIKPRNGASKGVLAEMIMHAAKEDAGTLTRLLTKEELEMLKMLVRGIESMDMVWDMEDDFPYTMEQILNLLELGVVDIGYFSSDIDITLAVRPVWEVMNVCHIYA